MDLMHINERVQCDHSLTISNTGLCETVTVDFVQYSNTAGRSLMSQTKLFKYILSETINTG